MVVEVKLIEKPVDNAFNFYAFVIAECKLIKRKNDFRKIVFNHWGQHWEDVQKGTQTDYQDLFEQSFTNILKTRIPQTNLIRDCIDRQELISNNQKYQKLRTAIISLCEELIDESLDIEGGF